MGKCMLVTAAIVLTTACPRSADAIERNCESDCTEECKGCKPDKQCKVTLGGRRLGPNVSNPNKYECVKGSTDSADKSTENGVGSGQGEEAEASSNPRAEIKNGKGKSREEILGIQKPELTASKASTLNKVAAIGGAATGVTSTITSGVGAFATDFSSMKSRIDACLNSLNISQN
ncbi:MAG: hypothetical protein LBI17_01400 [Rickettsiales bacterium]|jgi:hypothetical protein|nr:hypothetical protein [Rickettsiales bacterium]